MARLLRVTLWGAGGLGDTGEARGIGEGDAGGGVTGQSDEGASELGSGGIVGVEGVA